MSMFTPTSRYWNWVLTEPPKPLWNEPVAMGTRSPILREAFSLSRTRTSGRWRTLVWLSEARSEKEMPGMVTAKSPAERWVKVSRVRLDDPEEEPPEPELVVPPGARVTVALVGGLVPMVWE